MIFYCNLGLIFVALAAVFCLRSANTNVLFTCERYPLALLDDTVHTTRLLATVAGKFWRSVTKTPGPGRRLAFDYQSTIGTF